MVEINYGQTPEVWEKMQQQYREHLEKHPICELCQVSKSVRITPLGKIYAACLSCIENQRREMACNY